MIRRSSIQLREAGQASLEYILMLFTAAVLFLLLFNAFLKPVISKMMSYTSGRIDKALTQGDLHSLPFKK